METCLPQNRKAKLVPKGITYLPVHLRSRRGVFKASVCFYHSALYKCAETSPQFGLTGE